MYDEKRERESGRMYDCVAPAPCCVSTSVGVVDKVSQNLSGYSQDEPRKLPALPLAHAKVKS